MDHSTQHGTRAYTEIDQLSDSEYYHVLSSDRRRTTLDALEQLIAPVELKALAAAVATEENGVDALTDEVVNQVALTLHHVHLPKMAAFDVVEYDPDTARIESCPRNRT